MPLPLWLTADLALLTSVANQPNSGELVTNVYTFQKNKLYVYNWMGRTKRAAGSVLLLFCAVVRSPLLCLEKHDGQVCGHILGQNKTFPLSS